MKELTKEQFEVEFKTIEQNSYSLDEYLKASRVGSAFALNRKTKKYIYESYVYNKEIASLYEARCHNLFATSVNKGLSQNGMIAYNAICKHRDEVMLLDA